MLVAFQFIGGALAWLALFAAVGLNVALFVAVLS